jgi:hypothetical protein
VLRVLFVLLLLASFAAAGEKDDPVAALTAVVDSLLERDREPRHLEEILVAIRRTEGRPLPGASVSSILSIATEYPEMDDDPRRMAAMRAPSLAVLDALFYPRWRAARVAAGFRIDGLGFWPAPARVSDFFQFLPSARKTPDPITARPPIGAFRDYVTENDPADGVAVSARRVGGWLRIRIVNRGEKLLHVNPLAFRIGAAREITPQGGEPVIRLTLGAPSSNFRLEIPPDEELFPTIDPGGAKTFTYPVTGDSPIEVEFTDGFVLLKEKVRRLPHPRLRSFRAVPVATEPAPLTDRDREARALVDELVVRDSNRDLTTKVNRLLALGPKVVARALGDALDRACFIDSPADQARPRIYALAHLVGGLPPMDVDREWVIDRYPAVSGFVLGCETSGGRYFSEHLRLWGPPIGIVDLLGPKPRLVKPFEPDAVELFRRLLETDELTDPRRTGYSTRYAAGLAIGRAARTHPDLAARVLAAFGAHGYGEKEAGLRRLRALTVALGALGSEAARSALRKKIENVLELPKSPGLRAGLTGIVDAMLLAGDHEGVETIHRRVYSPGAPPIQLRWFLDAIGTERALAPLLRRAENRADGLTIHVIGQMLEEMDASELEPRTTLRLVNLAVRHSVPEVARQALWPRTEATFQSSRRTRHVSPGEVVRWTGRRETGRAAGGWPDPLRAARKLRDAVEAGDVRAARSDPESVYRVTRRPSPPSLRARRRGDSILLEIRNPGPSAISVNPLAFDFPLVDIVDVTDLDEERPENFRLLRFRMGRIVDGFRVSAGRLAVIHPDTMVMFVVPLQAKLPAWTRITVELDDRFGIEGEPRAPRVRRIPEVEVESY